MSVRGNSEIHIHAILEGTGHIVRSFHIAYYLNDYFSNIKVWIWDFEGSKKNQKWLYQFIKKMNFTNISHQYVNSFSDIQLDSNRFYILILDMRDHDPRKWWLYYPNSSIICMDNYYPVQYPYIQYWETLPHLNNSKSIKETLKNYFFPFWWIEKEIKKEKQKKHIDFHYIIVYRGIQSSFLPDHWEPDSILHRLRKNIKNFQIIMVDKNQYFSPETFYGIFFRSKIVITYPGLLLYESMILHKEVLLYSIKNQAHNQIIEKILCDCSDFLIEVIPYNQINFFYFDFSRLNQKTNSKIETTFIPSCFSCDFNLWTPYENLKNWIENILVNIAYDKQTDGIQ